MSATPSEPSAARLRALERQVFDRLFCQLKLDRLQSDLWVPLFLKDRFIGLLTIGNRPTGGPYDEADLEFIAQFAATAASSINMCLLYAPEKDRLELRVIEGLDNKDIQRQINAGKRT